MNKKQLSLLILTLLIVFNFLIWATPSHAYTGSIGIFPPLTGGPNHKTVTNIDVNTENQNPVWITTNLNFVESVVIQTNPAIDSHLLIAEYPDGNSVAFDFIVPSPFQDALVSATVYFWGPDVESLQIWHEHKGEPPAQLTGYKVQPVQRNADNNALWYFTTTSFSKFYLNNADSKINSELPIFTLFCLSLMCLSAFLVLRKN